MMPTLSILPAFPPSCCISLSANCVSPKQVRNPLDPPSAKRFREYQNALAYFHVETGFDATRPGSVDEADTAPHGLRTTRGAGESAYAALNMRIANAQSRRALAVV